MRCSTRRVRRRTYESIILHAAVPGLSRPEEVPEALHGGTWPGPGPAEGAAVPGRPRRLYAEGRRGAL